MDYTGLTCSIITIPLDLRFEIIILSHIDYQCHAHTIFCVSLIYHVYDLVSIYIAAIIPITDNIVLT